MTQFKNKKINPSYQFLRPEQRKAVDKMFNGCILNGGVGSGKSRTGLYYYFKSQGGSIDNVGNHKYMNFKPKPKDLYIITTAKKRDTKEWESELIPFLLSPGYNKLYGNTVVIDSWNNIGKYSRIKDAFFIFDEQKVVGYGKWSKTFIHISKNNKWILLSATPGDKWEDYIPVFIANGFYKNKTDFATQHLVYCSYTSFPKVDRYLGIRKLERLKNKLLIDMDVDRRTVRHHEEVYCDYDKHTYRDIMKNRWDPFNDEPIQQISGLCYILRRLINQDPSRQVALLEIFEKHPKMIVFYNFNYELDILKTIFEPFISERFELAEWNGHKHQPVPETDSWVYLVQYTAGAEGWNCITTDTIVFYSQNYSYKIVEQACGRIDRLNTPYKDLYYYHLRSRSGIDLGIHRALVNKKKFNERKFIEC